MDFNIFFWNISIILKGKLIDVLYFIDSHFTYLLILLVVSIGTILFFICGYMFRYNKYDFWRWKTKAAIRSIRLFVFLFILKGVIKAFL